MALDAKKLVSFLLTVASDHSMDLQDRPHTLLLDDAGPSLAPTGPV